MLDQCHNCTVEYKTQNHKEQYKERDTVKGKSSDLGPCFLFEGCKDSLSRSCLAVGNDETQNNSSNNNRHSRTEEQSIWNLSLTTNPIITSKKTETEVSVFKSYVWISMLYRDDVVIPSM